MNITFKKPKFKNTHYIANTVTPICYNIYDVRIHKIHKLQNDKGYSIVLHLSSDDQQFLTNIDNQSLNALIANNKQWFDNDLSDNDISEMYRASYCKQTETISILLPNNYSEYTRIHINGKLVSIDDFLEIVNMNYRKTHDISIQIQNIGMYIYSDQTVNRWIAKSINIHNLTDVDTESRGEIEEFWKELVDKCDETLEGRQNLIQNTRKELADKYSAIVSEKKSKDWECKIEDLKKLIQNIIF